MTTNTTMTAAEARRLADELAAAEADLADRKAQASKQGQMDAGRASFARADDEVKAGTLAAAQARWNELGASDDATIEDLWAAWNDVRVASAERAAIVRTADAAMWNLEPQWYENSTPRQPRRYRLDVKDTMEEASFMLALDRVSHARRQRAEQRAERQTQEAIAAAGEAAAAEVSK